MKSICMSNFFHPSLKTFDKTQERYYHIYEKSCRLKVGWYFFCAKVGRVQEIKEGSCNVKEEISYLQYFEKPFSVSCDICSFFHGMSFPSFGKCDFVPTSVKETWYRPKQTSILNRRRQKQKLTCLIWALNALMMSYILTFQICFFKSCFTRLNKRTWGCSKQKEAIFKIISHSFTVLPCFVKNKWKCVRKKIIDAKLEKKVRQQFFCGRLW